MVKIEGETGLLLEGVLNDICKKYEVSKADATKLFVNSALRCINSDDFYNKINYLLDNCLVSVTNPKYRFIGCITE